MTSTFNTLLRNSRVVSLHKPTVNTASPKSWNLVVTKRQPIDQIVGTTGASFHKRNWGLKSMIPKKHKSLYMNVKALDNETGLAQFDNNTGFYRKLQRFREFGVTPEYRHYPKYTPFLDAKTELDSASTAQIEREVAKRKQLGKLDPRGFQQFLQSKDISKQDFAKTRAEIVQQVIPEYLNMTKKTNYRPSSVIGINYSLQGSFDNTPNGIMKHRVIKGRVLKSSVTGLGGFTANVQPPINKPTTERYPVQQFVVTKAKADVDGKLDLHVAVAQENK